MRDQRQESPLGSVSRSRRRVISPPSASIRAEAIELSGELEQGLTTTMTSFPAYRPPRRRRPPLEATGGYLPPPNLERWKAYWNLPQKG